MAHESEPGGETLVLRSDRDGLATLTLNRPEKLNALSPATFVELRAHLDSIAADESIGCVVLGGARGTSRIEKMLIADGAAMAKEDALRRERTRPYGMPDDLETRMRSGWR